MATHYHKICDSFVNIKKLKINNYYKVNKYGQQHDRLVLTVKYSQSVLYGGMHKVENLLVKFDSFV
jgi:hypothetical protein